MTRVMKFKAWVPHTEQMYGPETLHTIQSMLTTMPKIGAAGAVYLQFTGCLDKYGNEIYEGDIVKHGSNNEIVGTIIFDRGMFRPDDEEGIPLAYNYYYLVVVGNIYENKRSKG